ncbi:MAG: ThuA domain-containing protein [Bryobacterales bacterium]|nr:ThuA domain-containing protein [Bryobacterales bacterium]
MNSIDIRKAAILTLALAAMPVLDAAAPRTQVLIVAGPSSHPPGTHEVDAGARLLDWAVENMDNVQGVRAEIVHQWPTDKTQLDGAATVVFIGDLFPPYRMPDSEAIINDLSVMMNRGVGIVCLHYANGLPAANVPPDGAHPLLRWLGGYFAPRNQHHQSVARVFESVIVTPAASDHPVSQGWQEFTLSDEPYYNSYFGSDGNKMAPRVTALATAMLPPEAPKREVIAWGVEREDGGRGFGIVMPHFYKNWANEDLRRFILNGVVWSAKRRVPQGGVRTPRPDLAAFDPGSVEPQPRTPARKRAGEEK